MLSRTLVLAGLLAIPLVQAGAAQALAQDTAQPSNNCAATDKIDATTANDARKRLESAGYTDVTGLMKGCDNVWHGQARANGGMVNVMVAPDGTVQQETN